MGGPYLFPPLALTLHLVSDPSQKMRETFVGGVPTGIVAQPTGEDFSSKFLGRPHTRGAGKRNYEKFGGQSIDYGGAVGVPLGVLVLGRKNYVGQTGPGESKGGANGCPLAPLGQHLVNNYPNITPHFLEFPDMSLLGMISITP